MWLQNNGHSAYLESLANDNMQMTECNETVAAHKAEADQLIPMLKRQVAETRSETRKWRHRCELLEMELLRMRCTMLTKTSCSRANQ